MKRARVDGRGRGARGDGGERRGGVDGSFRILGQTGGWWTPGGGGEEPPQAGGRLGAVRWQGSVGGRGAGSCHPAARARGPRAEPGCPRLRVAFGRAAATAARTALNARRSRPGVAPAAEGVGGGRTSSRSGLRSVAMDSANDDYMAIRFSVRVCDMSGPARALPCRTSHRRAAQSWRAALRFFRTACLKLTGKVNCVCCPQNSRRGPDGPSREASAMKG
jgi:hypothetical protein